VGNRVGVKNSRKSAGSKGATSWQYGKSSWNSLKGEPERGGKTIGLNWQRHRKWGNGDRNCPKFPSKRGKKKRKGCRECGHGDREKPSGGTRLGCGGKGTLVSGVGKRQHLRGDEKRKRGGLTMKVKKKKKKGNF